MMSKNASFVKNIKETDITSLIEDRARGSIKDIQTHNCILGLSLTPDIDIQRQLRLR
jgi:hypothetical protein